MGSRDLLEFGDLWNYVRHECFDSFTSMTAITFFRFYTFVAVVHLSQSHDRLCLHVLVPVVSLVERNQESRCDSSGNGDMVVH